MRMTMRLMMTLLETEHAKEKKTLRFRFSHSFIHCRHVSSQSSTPPLPKVRFFRFFSCSTKIDFLYR